MTSSSGAGDGERQEPQESQEGQEEVCGSVLHSQAENSLKDVQYLSKNFIFRKKGQIIDPGLKDLQERRPCVGLCFLLKKKMDLLEEEETAESWNKILNLK